MQVFELADDLGVSSDVVINLLRSLRISVADEEATVSEAEVSIVLAKVERERRAGHASASEAIEAAIEEAQASSGRRRRRRRSAVEAEPAEPEEVEEFEVVFERAVSPRVAWRSSVQVSRALPDRQVVPFDKLSVQLVRILRLPERILQPPLRAGVHDHAREDPGEH